MELRKAGLMFFCAAGLAICAMPGASRAQTLGKTVAIDAQDEYAQIEVEPSRSAMERLRSPDAAERSRVIDEVLAQPSRYNPAVLMAMSAAVFEQGKQEQGTFWYILGNTRAVADAQILTDRTAVPGLMTLRAVFGQPLKAYLIAHPDVEWAQTQRAVEWDRTHPVQYDRRWLSLHGMRAVQSALSAQEGQPDDVDEITVPQEKWAAMDEENRQAMLDIARRRFEASTGGQGATAEASPASAGAADQRKP